MAKKYVLTKHYEIQREERKYGYCLNKEIGGDMLTSALAYGKDTDCFFKIVGRYRNRFVLSNIG